MPRLNDPSQAKPRAVARALRDRIRSGEVRRGEPLPSLPRLASDLGVSDWTARRAVRLLVQEGLIEAVTGRGFRVRRHKPRIAVGVLFGGAMSSAEMSPYHRFTLAAVQAELKRRGCRPHVYATRSPDMTHYAGHAQLVRDLKRGVLGGVISLAWSPIPQPGADPSTPEGLAQLIIDRGVPHTGLSSSGRVPSSIGIDTNSSVQRLTTHLLDRGASDLHLMFYTRDEPEHTAGVMGFRAALKAHGLDDVDRRLILTDEPSDRIGYEAFTRWWEQHSAIASADAPMGLVVLDDILARGVVMGMLEQQVNVPEQLRLGVLSIKGGAFFSPRPLTRLVVDPEAMAGEVVARMIRMMRDPSYRPAGKHVQCQIVESGLSSGEWRSEGSLICTE